MGLLLQSTPTQPSRTRQACANACLSDVNCNAFAWNRGNHGCYLKAGFDARQVRWIRGGSTAEHDFCFLAAPRTAHDPQGYAYGFQGTAQHGYNSTVLNKCYANLTAVRVSNPGVNGWSGSIQFSTDQGATYKPGICISCTRGATDIATENEIIGPLASDRVRVDDVATGGRTKYAICRNKMNCTIVPFRRRINRAWFRGLTLLQDVSLSNNWLTPFAFMLGEHFGTGHVPTSLNLFPNGTPSSWHDNGKECAFGDRLKRSGEASLLSSAQQCPGLTNCGRVSFVLC